MSASAPEQPTARYRKSRTRSRTVSSRPALALSTLKLHQYNLDPAFPELICPDCKTWVPITGFNSDRKKLKLVPHDTGVAGKDASVRCRGSNRQVILDVEIVAWRTRLDHGLSQARGCRSARQHYKPLPTPARPVTRMTPAPAHADDVLAAYREHLKQCRASSAVGRCSGTHRCPDGVRLAALYERLELNQERRDKARKEAVAVQARQNRRTVAATARRTAAEWARQGEATTDVKQTTAKKSGTAVEEANNACRNRPADALSDYRHFDVPLKTLRISR